MLVRLTRFLVHHARGSRGTNITRGKRIREISPEGELLIRILYNKPPNSESDRYRYRCRYRNTKTNIQ